MKIDENHISVDQIDKFINQFSLAEQANAEDKADLESELKRQFPRVNSRLDKDGNCDYKSILRELKNIKTDLLQLAQLYIIKSEKDKQYDKFVQELNKAGIVDVGGEEEYWHTKWEDCYLDEDADDNTDKELDYEERKIAGILRAEKTKGLYDDSLVELEKEKHRENDVFDMLKMWNLYGEIWHKELNEQTDKQKYLWYDDNHENEWGEYIKQDKLDCEHIKQLEQLTTEQDCDEATAFLLCLVEENKEVFDSFTENILRIHLELCKIEREQMREYLPKIKSSLKGSHEKQNTTIYNYIINFQQLLSKADKQIYSVETKLIDYNLQQSKKLSKPSDFLESAYTIKQTELEGYQKNIQVVLAEYAQFKAEVRNNKLKKLRDSLLKLEEDKTKYMFDIGYVKMCSSEQTENYEQYYAQLFNKILNYYGEQID